MKRPTVREVQVVAIKQLTPHLKRIVLTGDALHDFPVDQQGAYVKVRIEEPGKKLAMRSYTIQSFDRDKLELALDFVVNQHQGPATNWANNVTVGNTISIGGPGPRKLETFDASTYVLIGDLTSINAVIAYANLISNSANVYAFIEAPTSDDHLSVSWPQNVQCQWFSAELNAQSELVAVAKQVVDLPEDTHVFIASEASIFRDLRAYFRDELQLVSTQIYASAYWKHGKNSDELSIEKRQDLA